jgi:hypothetical protein
MRHEFDPEDYAMVVKLRAEPPNPWKWEIYCAGKRLPIEQSESRFASMGAAHSAGKQALTQLIAKLSVNAPPQPADYLDASPSGGDEPRRMKSSRTRTINS